MRKGGGLPGRRLLSWMLLETFSGDLRGMKVRRAFAVVFLIGGGVMPVPAAEAPPGAASCSGCHPVKSGVDTTVPRLVGLDATAMAAALQAFRAGRRPATVMDRIAKGFSDDEIKAIAAWFSAQP